MARLVSVCWFVIATLVDIRSSPGVLAPGGGSTLSHPAFEPLTEHHALCTGLFRQAMKSILAWPIPTRRRRCCQCASSTTSQLELRASDEFDSTCSSAAPPVFSSKLTPNLISKGSINSPMLFSPRDFLLAASTSGWASAA